jgi:hypothetical protein
MATIVHAAIPPTESFTSRAKPSPKLVPNFSGNMSKQGLSARFNPNQTLILVKIKLLCRLRDGPDGLQAME